MNWRTFGVRSRRVDGFKYPTHAGASIPIGQGERSPNIYEGGTSMVMSSQYFRFTLSSNSNNCCLLYFNANIMCSFTKKLQLLWDFVPQASYWALPLDPAGRLPSPDFQSSFMSPNNPVRSTPLSTCLQRHPLDLRKVDEKLLGGS